MFANYFGANYFWEACLGIAGMRPIGLDFRSRLGKKYICCHTGSSSKLCRTLRSPIASTNITHKIAQLHSPRATMPIKKIEPAVQETALAKMAPELLLRLNQEGVPKEIIASIAHYKFTTIKTFAMFGTSLEGVAKTCKSMGLDGSRRSWTWVW